MRKRTWSLNQVQDSKKKFFMNKKGFTLVELTVVIAVVIILSSISVSMYTDHVLKAKVAEGYTLLGAIRDAQKQYFSEYECFLCPNDGSAASRGGPGAYTCRDEVFGIDARGNKYFTYFTIGEWANAEYMRIEVKSNLEGNIVYVYSKTGGETLTWNH